jgi:transcriptional regulator with XRE-family HTH domain
MPTIDAVKIGRRLRAERTRRFLTQVQLAEKAGISQKQLSKIENDEVEPRFSTILEPEIFLEGSA